MNRRGTTSLLFQWPTASALWWDDLGIFPAHLEVPPLHHIPNITLPTLHQMRGWSWYGKGYLLMANCKNWKTEASQASVCCVCTCYRTQCLANFDLEDTIDGWWDVVLPIGAIYRHIEADRHNSDYGLHRVLRVTICGISGMRNTVAAATGKSADVVVRNLFEPILHVARVQAKTGTTGRLNNDKANGKGKVRLECAAAVQFMRSQWWDALITM